MAQSDDKVVKTSAANRTQADHAVARAFIRKCVGCLQRGEIGTEERVLDYEIAAEFDCTRMPVRQALLRLANEGYLVGTTRGFVVPTITGDDIHEIFEVRRLLEPAAAASAAAMLTDKQEAELKKAYQKARRAYEKQDVDQMISANVEFRATWLEAVQNARLRATILSLRRSCAAGPHRQYAQQLLNAEDRDRWHAGVARSVCRTRTRKLTASCGDALRNSC